MQRHVCARHDDGDAPLILFDLFRLKRRFRSREDTFRKMVADRERQAFDAAAAKFHASEAERTKADEEERAA